MLTKLKNKIFLSLALGALVFIALSIYSDFDKTVGSFTIFNWSYLPVVLALAFLNYILRFIKWDFYLSQLKIAINKKDSLAVFLAGLTMSVTPGKLGEVLKSYFVKQLNDTPISRTAPIVIAERFTDFVALAILSVVGAFTFKYGMGVLIVSGLMICGFLVVTGSERISLRLISLFERTPALSRFARRLSTAYESISVMVAFKNLVWATVISIAAWFCECYGFYLVLKGFGTLVPVFSASFVYALSTIAGAITMLPGGLGATEGSMTGLLVLSLNVREHLAVASTFVIRACTLWFAVIVGAFVLLLNQRKFGRADEFLKVQVGHTART